jgi:hypothetical protein
MAFGSPYSLTINLKVYAFSLYSSIKFYGTETVPATETKSPGLPADLPAGRQVRSWFRFLLSI